MEDEGTVSLWVGKAATAHAVDQALQVSFSDDGDFLGSPFSRAFGIEYYEDSTREAAVKTDAPATLGDLLSGASYESTIVPRFERLGDAHLNGENTLILLYNIRYEGDRRTWTTEGLELRFVGWVRYD